MPAGTDDFDAWLPLTAGGAPRAFIRVDVRDSGPGIPAAQRAALFEKFAQGEGGKRAAHGVGLGLYISREIVRRHGGTIWVESEPGKGACFCFRIPTTP
jgi:signal transduction histidine kinase